MLRKTPIASLQTARLTAELASIANGGCRWPRVTGGAGHRRVVRLVAADTACHRSDAGGLGHGVELAYVAVARHALHARLQMLTVRPRDPRSDAINPHPRNRLAGLGECRELYDGRLILRNGHV